MQEADHRRAAEPAHRALGFVTNREGIILPVRTRPEAHNDAVDSADDRLESGDHGDDDAYSDAAREEERKARYRKSLDPNHRTQVDDDQEDEEDFEDEAEPTTDEEGAAAGKKRKGKGKQKQKAPTKRAPQGQAKGKGKVTAKFAGVSLPRSDEDVDDNEDDTDGREHTRGPIPQACKDAVREAKDDFHTRLKEIAEEYNRPVRTILELAGEVVSVPRAQSLWNMFQQWYAQNGDERKPPDSNFAVLS
jgi:hypothetical protein